jgi:hypothetical protein
MPSCLRGSSGPTRAPGNASTATFMIDLPQQLDATHYWQELYQQPLPFWQAALDEIAGEHQLERSLWTRAAPRRAGQAGARGAAPSRRSGHGLDPTGVAPTIEAASKCARMCRPDCGQRWRCNRYGSAGSLMIFTGLFVRAHTSKHKRSHEPLRTSIFLINQDCVQSRQFCLGHSSA